ncbi:hypothetical protein VaNZ11_005576, partial [Volvox africanus]
MSGTTDAEPSHPDWDPEAYSWDGVALTATRKPRRGARARTAPETSAYAEYLDKDVPMLMSRPPVGALSKAQRLVCQIQGCNRNLQNSKLYYQRFKLCEDHLKAPAISIDGMLSRLCQQCGRFHELSAFEGKKRTCRSQLDRIRKAKELRKRNAASSDSPERDVDGEADAEDTMAVDATTAARRRGAAGGRSGAGYGGRVAVTTATGKWTSTNSRSSEHTSSGSANAGQQEGSGGGGAAVTAASVGDDASRSRRGQEGKPRCMQDANLRSRSREDAGAGERHDGTNGSAAQGVVGHANGGPMTLMLSDAAPYERQQDITFDIAWGYGSSLERGVGRGGGSSASGCGGPVMAGLDEATGGTTAAALVVPQLAGGSSAFPDTATRDHHRHPAHHQPQHMSEQQQLLVQLQRVQQEKDAQKQLMRAAAGLPPGGRDLGAGLSQLWVGGGRGSADQQLIDQSQGTAGALWGLNQHVSAASGNSWLLARKAQQELGSMQSGWSSDLQADASPGPGPGLAAATAAASFLPGASTPLASAAVMNTKAALGGSGSGRSANTAPFVGGGGGFSPGNDRAPQAATLCGDYKQGLPDMDKGRGSSGLSRLAEGLTPTSGLCPAPKRPHNSHHHHNQQQQQLLLLQHQGSAAAGLTCDALERKAPECTTLANEGELQGLLEELASTGLDGEPRGIATLMSCGSTVPAGELAAAAAASKSTAMHGAVESGGVAAAGSGLLMLPSRTVDRAAGISDNRFFPMGHLPHQDAQQISSGSVASGQGRASSPIALPTAQQLQAQPTAAAEPQSAPTRLTISEGITLAASYALGMAGSSSKDHPQTKVWPEAKQNSRSGISTTDNGLMAIYDAMMHPGSDLEMETETDAAGSLQHATQHHHQQQLLLQRLRAQQEQRSHLMQQQQQQQHIQNFQQQQNLRQQAGLRMSAIQHSQQQQQQQQGVNTWAQAAGNPGRALSGAPQGPSLPGTLLGHNSNGGSGGLGGSGSGGTGGPPYIVRDHMSRVTLKLMNCLPDELPHTLRANLQRWVANRAAAEILQACMRPGCLELVVDVVHNCPDAEFVASTMAHGRTDQARRALNRIITERLAADNEAVMEVGGLVLTAPPCNQEQAVIRVWEEAAEAFAAADGRKLTSKPHACADDGASTGPASPTAPFSQPAIRGSLLAAVRSAPVVYFVLYGDALTDDDVDICARMGGQNLRVIARKLPPLSACRDPGNGVDRCPATTSRVGVLVQPVRQGGLLILEPRRGRLLGKWWPLVVVPEPHVAGELNGMLWDEASRVHAQVEEDSAPTGAATNVSPVYDNTPDWMRSFLVDLGQVLDWVGWQGQDDYAGVSTHSTDLSGSGETWGSGLGGSVTATTMTMADAHTEAPSQPAAAVATAVATPGLTSVSHGTGRTLPIRLMLTSASPALRALGRRQGLESLVRGAVGRLVWPQSPAAEVGQVGVASNAQMQASDASRGSATATYDGSWNASYDSSTTAGGLRSVGDGSGGGDASDRRRHGGSRTPGEHGIGDSDDDGGSGFSARALAALRNAEVNLELRLFFKACRLLAFCVIRGLVHTASLLWGLLTVQGMSADTICNHSLYDGEGLLMCAVRSSSRAMVEALLARDVNGTWAARDVGRLGPSGFAPLHVAATLPGCFEAGAALLVGIHSAPHRYFLLRSACGSTPAQMAARCGNNALNVLAAQLVQGPAAAVAAVTDSAGARYNNRASATLAGGLRLPAAAAAMAAAMAVAEAATNVAEHSSSSSAPYVPHNPWEQFLAVQVASGTAPLTTPTSASADNTNGDRGGASTITTQVDGWDLPDTDVTEAIAIGEASAATQTVAERNSSVAGDHAVAISWGEHHHHQQQRGQQQGRRRQWEQLQGDIREMPYSESLREVFGTGIISHQLLQAMIELGLVAAAPSSPGTCGLPGSPVRDEMVLAGSSRGDHSCGAAGSTGLIDAKVIQAGSGVDGACAPAAGEGVVMKAPNRLYAPWAGTGGHAHGQVLSGSLQQVSRGADGRGITAAEAAAEAAAAVDAVGTKPWEHEQEKHEQQQQQLLLQQHRRLLLRGLEVRPQSSGQPCNGSVARESNSAPKPVKPVNAQTAVELLNRRLREQQELSAVGISVVSCGAGLRLPEAQEEQQAQQQQQQQQQQRQEEEQLQNVVPSEAVAAIAAAAGTTDPATAQVSPHHGSDKYCSTRAIRSASS